MVRKDFSSLKAHYHFTREDEERLQKMRPCMESRADEFLDGFYEHIWAFGKTSEFLKDDVIIARHKDEIRRWYLNLFSGNYEITYFLKLFKIGEVHVKLGLPTHYVNAAFNYVRIFIVRGIYESCTDGSARSDTLRAAEKIIDINLDILTSSYREEEMSRFLSLSKPEKALLGFLKRFNSYINFVLALALMLVAFFAIGLFCYDVYLLLSGQVAIEKGILTVLGSLLILWAAVELIHEEIKNLRGSGVALEAFIALAIAALIRKILIFSLSSEKVMDVLYYGLLVLCLGIVYWLIATKVRPRSSRGNG